MFGYVLEARQRARGLKCGDATGLWLGDLFWWLGLRILDSLVIKC